MGKGSGAEAAHTLDPHGNQVTASGESGAASASREIFQGLFKDLGKQAMAMESILRLVCGKVDKLEHWVTEMSFGMTELDLQLRNIAHNIEGTAANVDDVPSASRWAVPQEQNDVPTATVVKKVGVGLNKKKQMRMTGMVANILDQLTAVAETPMVAAESENESTHKGDEKKKAKTKAKKAKASVVGNTSGIMSPLSASSAATTPRASERTEKAKPSKKKAHKHADTDIAEETASASIDIDAGAVHETAVHSDTGVVAEELRNALVDHIDTPSIEEHNISTPPPYEIEDAPLKHDEQHLEASGRETPLEDEPLEEEMSTQSPVISAATESVEIADESGSIESAVEETATESVDEVLRDESEASEQRQASPENTMESLQPIIDAIDTPAQLNPSPTTSTTSETPVAVIEEVDSPTITPSTMEIPIDSDAPSLFHLPDPPSDETATLKMEQILAEHHQLEPREDAPGVKLPSHSLESTASAMSSRSQPQDVGPDHAISAPSTPQTDREVESKNTFDTRGEPVHEHPASISPSVDVTLSPLQSAVSESSSFPATETIESTSQLDGPVPLIKKSPSKRLRRVNSGSGNDNAQQPTSPTKRGSRRASIRKSVTQRQTSIKRKQMLEQPHKEEPSHEATSPAHPPTPSLEHVDDPVGVEAVAVSQPRSLPEHAPTSFNDQQDHIIETISSANEQEVPAKTEEEDDSDEDDDDDEDDDGSSVLGSDSDESVLDLNESPSSSKAPATVADKKMSMKMTRTLSALNKLKKAEVLTPEEIAELKQRANQKWFKLRDHVKEKNKKDVANILLKRKKNIFTVSNRIELLEEKSREVYASIKQLNTELKGKVELSTFEGLRRHVHDIHVSLQVLDDKISKGNTPAMDHIKQLAKDTEAMRLFFLEQLELAREHCDANHRETITMFDDQWQHVVEIEKSIRDKLTSLIAEYDDKLHDLPDYTDTLEGIRRAIRKKADLKALRELEARLLGNDAEAEDCLIRCLSCHKEVVNSVHDDPHPQDDGDAGAMGSPHFKRVNPGTSSARVYRSNVPLNALPIGVPETSAEFLSPSDDCVSPSASAVGSTSKSVTPSRARTSEPRPSPLSFIHVTATRAIAANTDSSRPISAPVSALKKKSQPKSNAQ